jgi:acetyl esterase/lipase
VARRRWGALTAALVGALVALVPAVGASAGTGLVSEREVATGVLKQTHAYGPEGQSQTLDVYVTADVPRPPKPTVLFVHGGSWAIGDKSEWAKEATEVARRGWVAASLNYRLTGEAPWPAQRDDVSAALAYLQANAAVLGIDAARIGVIGDSAGGHLAALLGTARPGQAAVRGVVTLSGVNDMPGLLRQRSSGGCTTPGCSLSGLALRVRQELMRCSPAECASAYREASPGALVTATSPATLAFNSEGELIDPRQAWVMDTALRVKGRPSRVHVLSGVRHARGYQDQAFEPAMRFLAAVLTPETAPPYPRPTVTTTLDASTRVTTPGTPVRLRGVVRPRAFGSSVALQVRGGDGTWRTARVVPLQRGTYDTYYDTTWTPAGAGTTTWRAVWTGGGGTGVSPAVTVTAR